MNENLDLTKILEGCPSGVQLYSTLHGDATLVKVTHDKYYPIEFTYRPKVKNLGNVGFVTADGRPLFVCDGECTLFPSKEQRDWSKFERFWDKPKVQRFDVNTLQPFDKVLSRYGTESNWMCTFFSHIIDKVNPYVDCNGITVNVCIPYNDDTKHLVGTNKDCPEYYKWWEE